MSHNDLLLQTNHIYKTHLYFIKNQDPKRIGLYLDLQLEIQLMFIIYAIMDLFF
jgi:hypothetical protein